MNILTEIYLLLFFFGIFFLLIFVILHYRNVKKLYDYPIPKRYPTISFLVPAYNEEKSLEGTVLSLIKMKYPKGKKEIIIINDGSKDGTREIARRLEKKYSEVKLLDKPNSGKADSLNAGIKIAKGELIAVSDADSYPQEDAVLRMVGYFDDPMVGAVTSRVLVKNKGNILCQYQVMDYSIIAWTRKLLDFVDSVYVTNGPLSIYRKSIVKEVGGFDPKNLTEDIEITWNILSHGYKTRMSYSAIAYTVVPEKLKIWIKQRVRWNLGGLQTAYKYRKYMFTYPGNQFGRFVIPYVSSSFALAILGFILFARYLWMKGSYYVVSGFYAFKGYNPFLYLDFVFYPTLLLFFGLLFFIMAIFYYKVGLKHSERQNKSILNILIYSFVYRTLYIVPLLLALWKLARGDISWYTK